LGKGFLWVFVGREKRPSANRVRENALAGDRGKRIEMEMEGRFAWRMAGDKTRSGFDVLLTRARTGVRWVRS